MLKSTGTPHRLIRAIFGENARQILPLVPSCGGRFFLGANTRIEFVAAAITGLRLPSGTGRTRGRVQSSGDQAASGSAIIAADAAARHQTRPTDTGRTGSPSQPAGPCRQSRARENSG